MAMRFITKGIITLATMRLDSMHFNALVCFSRRLSRYVRVCASSSFSISSFYPRVVRPGDPLSKRTVSRENGTSSWGKDIFRYYENSLSSKSKIDATTVSGTDGRMIETQVDEFLQNAPRNLPSETTQN